MGDENSDRISNLHDSLLIEILSRLRARDVVQTCILSKRWRNLWAFVPSLYFDLAEFRGEVEKFNNFVSSFLSLRDEASKVYTFTLSYSAPYDDEICDLVRTWIMYALERKVKNLVVDLWGNRCLFQPNCFICDSLEYMHLNGIDLIEPDIMRLPKLRYLRLYRVFMQDSFMQKLLSGCSTLETLNIHRGVMLGDKISFHTVKFLTFIDCGFYSNSPTSPTFSIYAPYLEYIKFVNCHGHSITFKDMSKLTEVMFIKPITYGIKYGFDIPGGISGVKILYLWWPNLKEILNGEVQKYRTFQELKYLTMGVCCMRCDFDSWSSFLKCCPNLKSLCLLHTEEYCKNDHSGEVDSEKLKEIEVSSCRNLKMVQVRCVQSYYSANQVEQLVLQMTKKLDGVHVTVSEQRSKLRSAS